MSSDRPLTIDIIRQFHDGKIDVADSILERALQIAPSAEKRSGGLPSLLRRFGNQNFTFGGMPFHQLREIFRVIKPRDDVSYLLLNNPFFPDMAKRFIDQLTVARKHELVPVV
jgi:hypothetical protein